MNFEQIEMMRIIELIKKYKAFLAYAFFGVCTTMVNMIAYNVCMSRCKIGNIPSTIVAWILAVLFAFITNKLWVFESRSFKVNILIHEVVSFFMCRLLTGVLDVLIMYIAVDVMRLNATLWKLLSNILVIILNYIASKIVIFRRK